MGVQSNCKGQVGLRLKGLPIYCLFPQLFYSWDNKNPTPYQAWENTKYGQSVTLFRKRTLGGLFLQFGAIDHIQHRSTHTIYPYNAKNDNCTLLLLSNLAYPQWVTINCNYHVASHIVCVIPRNDTLEILEHQSTLACTKFAILKSNMCYMFVWFDGGSGTFTKVESTCTGNMMIPSRLTLFKRIGQILTSASVRHISLLTKTLLHDNSLVEYIIENIWHAVHYTRTSVTMQQARGFIVCERKATKRAYFYNNTFICENESIISIKFVCDDKNDCSNNISNSTDEMFCICGKQFFQKEKLDKKFNCECSPLHYKTLQGNCSSFQLSEQLNNESKHDFICKDKSVIYTTLENDLIPDCGPLR